MRDPYPEIETAYREEVKAKGPCEKQVALAETLEAVGNWPVFLTWTFRPNPYEEIVWNRDDKAHRNLKVSWTEGEKVARTRPDRNGAIKTGTRRIAPGWSSWNAMGKVIKFIAASKDLRRGRWYTCAEPHKYRDGYHCHSLFAGNVDANWEAIARDATKKFGRFSMELVRDANGMAGYLAKKYVGKFYGTEDFRCAWSRNCRTPKPDDTPPIQWKARHDLFLNSYTKKNWMTKAIYRRVRESCEKTNDNSLCSHGE